VDNWDISPYELIKEKLERGHHALLHGFYIVNRNLGDHQGEILYDIETEQGLSLDIYAMELESFFNKDYLEKFFSYYNINVQFFLVFEDISVKEVKVFFSKLGYVMSGGIDSSKHILSPHQYMLSQIIEILYHHTTLNMVTKSFADIGKTKEGISRKLVDTTSKKDREIIKKIIIETYENS
jgi:hypothetical protein